MLQIHKPLSRKLWIYSTIALIGVGGPALVYGMSITPEYAKAVEGAKTLSDISTMQEMTANICGDSKIGEENLKVKDSRDGSEYSIKKINNTQCWMTQNLRLTAESLIANGRTPNEDGTVTITEADTNIHSTWGAPWYSGTFDVPTSNTSDSSYSIYYDNRVDYGAYYSWQTAVAGAYRTGYSAGGSICPKGWSLPRGGDGSGNDFAIAMGYNKYIYINGGQIWDKLTPKPVFADGAMMANGFTWPAAGYYRGGSLYGAGTNGYYWAGNTQNSSSAYSFYFFDGYMNVVGGNEFYYSYPIRCVIYGSPTQRARNINVSVSPTLTIDATSGMNSEVEASTVAMGNITARISSNTAYKVLLSASASNPGNKTSLYRRTDDMKEGTTPTYDTTGENIPATSTVEANQNGWGISNACNQDGSNLAYLPITTIEKEYCGSSKESATYDEATQQYTHTFGIGISVSPSLGSGTYETSITVTGVAN